MSCLWPQSGHTRRPGFRPEFLTVNETPKSGRLNDRFREELPLVQVRRKVFFRPVMAIVPMSEAEILELIKLNQSEGFAIIQWWGAVTFGMVALAHVARNQLNLYLVILILALYVSFTFLVIGLLVRGDAFFFGLLEDLRFLEDAEGRVSAASQAILDSTTSRNRLQALGFMTLPGAFLGSIGYVIYRYAKGRQ